MLSAHPKRKRIVLVAAATCGALVIAGGAYLVGQSSGPTYTVAGISTTKAPDRGQASDSIDMFVNTIATADTVPEWEKVSELAAPKSPATFAATYHSDWLNADIDSGQGLAPEVDSVVSEENNGYRVCPSKQDGQQEPKCDTFGGFVLDSAGKVSSYTLNGKPLAERSTFVEGVPPESKGLKIQVSTAYQQTTADQFTITLKLRTAALNR